MTGPQLGEPPRGAQAERSGSLGQDIGGRRDLTGTSQAILYVGEEADAQLACGGDQGLESVPSDGAVPNARAETDGALAHALPGSQFGRVVVEREGCSRDCLSRR